MIRIKSIRRKRLGEVLTGPMSRLVCENGKVVWAEFRFSEMNQCWERV